MYETQLQMNIAVKMDRPERVAGMQIIKECAKFRLKPTAAEKTSKSLHVGRYVSDSVLSFDSLERGLLPSVSRTARSTRTETKMHPVGTMRAIPLVMSVSGFVVSISRLRYVIHHACEERKNKHLFSCGMKSETTRPISDFQVLQSLCCIVMPPSRAVGNKICSYLCIKCIIDMNHISGMLLHTIRRL